ncbi:4-amino-4-deoxy-L-arabinose transferase-like glycosyltransferase [Pseudomonas sp. PvR086]|jgi:4-amino-4-deoxy-L-arabinose transferase-like glycosyltransferase|uniref:ArnT family glycosyltransferase n=1 Tax=Pseudomonas TaxID=286 RepID=UPI000B360B49|nr:MULTISPECIES: glycosyltransferase family 39 protein [Pseudomonas]MBD9604294.1 glycosyltransferase family 39 protein [Pseudomonas sp. PDM08]PMY52627.1 glycosyltransferase [Pseudomonas sp. FW305-53]PMY85569.1 glycosyltransferase [Pseudomonas sp. FW303-C2]PMY92596.1 glycosyltransferase [Pseudomonas sp. FW305-62]PNA45779.1 glycosyltransferase [Pseudomonas sp. FW306-2-2C-A10BC]
MAIGLRRRVSTVSPSIRRQSLGFGLLTFMLFIAGVYQQTAIGFDSRFVLFAQEMLRHGPSFFPTTYGQPYADYSALSTVFVWLLSLPFGQVNSLTAWLPTAIGAAVIVTLMYRLVAPCSTRWALLSIALMLLTSTFVTETRAVSQDLMLAAVAFSVFYLGYAADHFAMPRRWPLIFVLLLLGFGIRGPIGLVIPTGMLCSYYLLNRQWSRLFGFGLLAAVLLVVCVGALLWLAEASGGTAFMHDVVRMQFMGRMDGSEGVSGSLYYFTASFGNYALAYPLALLVLAAVWLTNPRQAGPALRLLQYCTAAGLIVMIGLSIPQAKKARYLLPMLPMAAIIAAYPFQVAQGRVFGWLRGLMQGLWLVIPGVLIVALLIIQRRLPAQPPAFVPVLIVLAALQVITLAAWFRAHWRAEVLACCAVLALWSVYILVYEPVERQLYDTQAFSRAAFAEIQKAPAPLVLHGMGKDAKAIKFMVNIEQDFQPVFTESTQELEALSGPAWLMMDRNDYNALQGTPLGAQPPVLSGRFDKNDFVLLHTPPL